MNSTVARPMVKITLDILRFAVRSASTTPRILTNSGCSRLAALYSSSRKIHVTCKYAEKSDSPPGKQKTRKKNMASKNDKSAVTDEMKTAARDVAKSMGGDWTKTAEELLARLSSHQQPPPTEETPDEAKQPKTTQAKSLLGTMRVGKGFTVDSVPKGRKVERVQQTFESLYGEPRLGIFDAEKVKANLAESERAETENEDLWHTVDKEKLWKRQGGIPRNAFEDMAQWTRQGKMWKFPIDNEEDMHDERQYKFYDHIFLDQHLGEFPDQGPIRKFMELVVIGLGSNPWLTVPEKRGHIQWYADYFREKQDVLVASLGEQGKMKEKGGTAQVQG